MGSGIFAFVDQRSEISNFIHQDIMVLENYLKTEKN
jgi:hypothetical protein